MVKESTQHIHARTRVCTQTFNTFWLILAPTFCEKNNQEKLGNMVLLTSLMMMCAIITILDNNNEMSRLKPRFRSLDICR